MKPYLAIVAALPLAACTSTEGVHLKHPETGQTVQCGPYSYAESGEAEPAALRQNQCIEDYKEQGYQRSPGPATAFSRLPIRRGGRN